MKIKYKDKEIELLFLVKSGSRLYGTQFEKGEHNLLLDYVSDFDYKGVFSYSKEENFKIRRNSLHKIIPSKEKNQKNTQNNKIELNKIINQKFANLNLNIEEDDVDLYELRHFLELASTNNPNIMDLLFVPLEDYIYISEKGKEILNKRDLFISNQIIPKFVGYANEQLSKIKSHKKWINKYPKINNIYLKLTDLYNSKIIDYSWISDIFGGKLAKKISNLSQEEVNKLGKIKSISWEEFLISYSDNFITKEDWKNYRKPELINYCSFKDVTTHKYTKDTLIYSEIPNKDIYNNKLICDKFKFNIQILEKKDIQNLLLEKSILKKELIEIEKEQNNCNSTEYSKKENRIFLIDNLLNSPSIIDFCKNNCSFRQVNKSLYNIFTKPYKEYKSTLFTRNGYISNNSSEEIGIFAFSMGYDLEKYKQKEKEITDLWTWKCGRNEKRGILEETYGYDVKNGAHLYRLMLQANEILKNGIYNPILKEENLKKIKSVLLGKINYDNLIEITEKLKKDIKDIKNKLPEKIEDKKIDEILLNFYNYK